MASMLEALQPHPEDHLHLRLHRARLVEIRAAQRTFEGAYMRTALSQFSFALVVLKIFTSDFYPIGALLACYGAAVLLVAVYRRYEGNRQFFDREESESESESGGDSSEGSVGGQEEEGTGEGGGGIDGRGRARARVRRRERVWHMVVTMKSENKMDDVPVL
ncbi:hypothetical protein CHGG_00942 [Chaetomium globosum CBS 148.51]|uniref:DUF202 domain-containing protein n=1 Tax=Chaetomium globosum (strain ATCC 6205 / CBS 148.51 / DSM 1962 / NBRC 6347 / NRRL 1970) TaxID=306901 RepID=Q2HFR2_CHAGB|nr:uncharacterized protein CHGG_00942 [Chaetomium globosum CBS 148.51]EAQ92707.1 hypothetical protein CHGG_00942 [Chaetomium globosum CBS 148.51]